MKEELAILYKKINMFNEFYQKSKENNTINEIELKEYLYDILSWIEICIKYIEKYLKLDRENWKLVNAFKYANNMKKHNQLIYKCTFNRLGTFPSSHSYPFPTLYPSSFNICWRNLPFDPKSCKKQWENYNIYLKDKNIYETINSIFEIIKQYSKFLDISPTT